MRKRGGRRVGAAVVALAAALLAGCAIAPDLRLNRQGAGLPAGAKVTIEPPTSGNPRAARLATALSQALVAGGHTVVEDAPITAVIGLSQRPRDLGMADAAPAEATDKNGVQWISAPARTRILQACKGERLRATLALFSRVEGTLIYRATGEVDGCKFGDADIDALAQALVRDATR